MTSTRSTPRPVIAAIAAIGLIASACGGSAAADGDDPAGPSVVVTTSVLGDIVGDVLADTGAVVEVLMPPGTDPHGYAPSAADGLALREADLVVAIGLGLEEALMDTITAAEEDGVAVVQVAGLVDPIPFSGVGHAHGEVDDHEGDEDHADHDEDHADHDEDHADEDHADEDHADEGDDHGHDDGALDPHVWLDPVRVGQIAEEVASAYADISPGDGDTVVAAAAAYVDRMTELDTELQAMVDQLPADRRALITNHDALGYLADRYELDVVATVLPGTSTEVDPTAADFAALVELLEDTGVPAVFAETTSTDRLARALAAEVPGVDVVELFTGSLGEPDSNAATVPGMLRTNVELIVDALA